MKNGRSQESIYPYEKMKLDDAIRHLDFHDKRAEIGWNILVKNGMAKSNRARLAHLCVLFERGTISKIDDKKFPALIKSVEKESKGAREKCIARYAKSIRLFSTHGSKKEKEVRCHLNFCVKNGGDFYRWLLEDLDEGLACEKALNEKNYVFLFYSLLRSLHRSISNSRTQYTKKRRASIWVLRATENKGFTEWLLKLKRVPKRPEKFEKFEAKESTSIFNKLEYVDSDFKLVRRFWMGSHRNALHVLFLHAGKKIMMKAGRFDPFVSLSRIGDLDSIDYLFELGIFSDSLSAALTVATVAPKALKKLTDEFILTKTQLSNAMLYLCRSQIYFNPKSYNILKAAGVKVCNQVKGTTYLHIAIRNANVAAIRMLLDDGVDPFNTDSNGKMAIETSRFVHTLRFLNKEIKRRGLEDKRQAPTEFTNSEAVALFKSNEKSFSTAEKKNVRKALKDGKIPLKLSMQKLNTFLLSRALVGIYQKPKK